MRSLFIRVLTAWYDAVGSRARDAAWIKYCDVRDVWAGYKRELELDHTESEPN